MPAVPLSPCPACGLRPAERRRDAPWCPRCGGIDDREHFAPTPPVAVRLATVGMAAVSTLLGALAQWIDALISVAVASALLSLTALALVSWHPRRRAGMGWRIGATLALALVGSGLVVAALLER